MIYNTYKPVFLLRLHEDKCGKLSLPLNCVKKPSPAFEQPYGVSSNRDT